jgi:hypothetical protein
VPSFEDARIHGDSNLRPVRDGLRILATIVRERLPFFSVGSRGEALAELPAGVRAEVADARAPQ